MFMDPLPLLGRRESNGGGYRYEEEEHRGAAGDDDGPLLLLPPPPPQQQQQQPPLFGRPAPLPSSPSSSSSSARQFSGEEGGAVAGGGGRAPALGFVEKEHMFDKVVTPSDVGKLNRLVIPKQHAEKYFPLDAASGEKGLLLGFEDRTGKHWRFRYSYWNSSQSYVMTKGWSRFVKEKRLGAGDTVSFGRGVGEAGRDRLFIDWKHRPDALPPFQYPLLHRLPLPFHGTVDPSTSVVVPFAHHSGGAVPWGTARLVMPPPTSPFSPVAAVYDHLYYAAPHNPAAANPYNLHPRTSGGNPPSQAAVQQQFIGSGSGGTGDGAFPMTSFRSSVPAAHGGATARNKTVRLFGVNLGYCSPSEGVDGGAGSDAAAVLQRGHAPSPALPPLRTSPGDHQSPGTDLAM